MRHLLVTNDFPPKIGGIQSYLWELWRRLPPQSFSVLTTPYAGDRQFDAAQAFRVERTRQRWLLPTPSLIRQVEQLVEETQADLVVLDPTVPLGIIGPRLRVPYVVVGHGAEYVIPQRLWLTRPWVQRVTRHAAGLLGGGRYVEAAMQRVAARGGRELPSVSIVPGVDVDRFAPIDASARAEVRARFGIEADAPFVLGVSRLVPRKGFDRLVRAAARLRHEHPDVVVAIAGAGRDAARLRKLAARLDAPVRFLGRVDDADLPSLYGAADVFCMPCHDRWWGLEQEGFGIVFAEAAAAGVPSVAGASGGSGEAVLDGSTGFVVPGRVDADEVADRLSSLLADADLRQRFGGAARRHAQEHFGYDELAVRLQAFLEAVGQQVIDARGPHR